jgi:FdhD protein
MDVSTLMAELSPVRSGVTVPLRVLYEIPGLVRARQKLFQATGGTHAAALFGPEGRILAMSEDLGRHNAFDKAIGRALLEGIPFGGRGAFLTGRVTLEMIVKAVRAGIPVVAAVSAASAAAVEAAERLCGFVRGEEVTVYTHPERIVEK